MENLLTSLPRELVCEFFLTFARFEFALKNSGFLAGDHHQAKPDWDGFARSLRHVFKANAKPELAAASDYLLMNPPLHQVVWYGELMWDAAVPEHQSDIERLLYLVRRVRNNLFHGGKFRSNVVADFPPGSERKRLLLESSLCILRKCLELSPDVQTVYESATL